jgi:hypothetical protein
MDHLSRTVSWPLLQDHVGRLQNMRPRGRPARPGAASRRIRLPAHDRPRGRSRPTVSCSPDTAAIRQGPLGFRPFDGSIRPRHQILWEILQGDAAGLWPEETCALTSPVIRDVRASAQCEYSRCTAAGAFQSLLDHFGAAGAGGLKSQARLHS